MGLLCFYKHLLMRPGGINIINQQCSSSHCNNFEHMGCWVSMIQIGTKNVRRENVLSRLSRVSTTLACADRSASISWLAVMAACTKTKQAVARKTRSNCLFHPELVNMLMWGCTPLNGNIPVNLTKHTCFNKKSVLGDATLNCVKAENVTCLMPCLSDAKDTTKSGREVDGKTINILHSRMMQPNLEVQKQNLKDLKLLFALKLFQLMLFYCFWMFLNNLQVFQALAWSVMVWVRSYQLCQFLCILRGTGSFFIQILQGVNTYRTSMLCWGFSSPTFYDMNLW